MPSFSPFRTLTLFPKPATKDSVKMFGDFGEDVSTTTLVDGIGAPFWWLLYKASFSVEWSYATDEEYSGSFTVEFSVNPLMSPNEKICTEELLLSGEGEFTVGPISPSGTYGSYFSVEPFRCDDVHAMFYVLGEEIGVTAGFTWYISSAPPIEYGNDQIYNISTEEQTITLPDGNDVTLYKYIDFFDAGYTEDLNPQSTITNLEIEWYTLN
jgi:hypothetical protein